MDTTNPPKDIYQMIVDRRDQAKAKLEAMLARGGHSPADLKEARKAYNWHRVQLAEIDDAVAYRLEQEDANEALLLQEESNAFAEHNLEPEESVDQDANTIPCPPSDDLLAEMVIPESARLFVLSDVQPLYRSGVSL